MLAAVLSSCGSDGSSGGASGGSSVPPSGPPSAVSSSSAASSPASSSPASSAPVTSASATSTSPGASPEASAAATSSVAAASKPVVTPSAAAPAPPPRTAPPGGMLLVLEPDGVGLLRGASVRHFPFGTGVDTVSLALSATLGKVSRATQPACGQGPRVQLTGQGFTALFNGSRFVGWVDHGRSSPRLTSMNGIGVGTTLAALQARSPSVQVTDGSLGPEWSVPARKAGAPTLGGLLDGTSATSRITTIYAGETCFFR